jgi:hypothetical protein
MTGPFQQTVNRNKQFWMCRSRRSKRRNSTCWNYILIIREETLLLCSRIFGRGRTRLRTFFLPANFYAALIKITE